MTAQVAARTSAALTAGRRRTCHATTTSATSSTTSFQAATTSRAVPRTPRSQSCAIASLCTARPTTRTANANPMKRRPLIDDRHQREPEADDPHAPGEERLQAPAGQEVDVVRELLSG